MSKHQATIDSEGNLLLKDQPGGHALIGVLLFVPVIKNKKDRQRC